MGKRSRKKQPRHLRKQPSDSISQAEKSIAAISSFQEFFATEECPCRVAGGCFPCRILISRGCTSGLVSGLLHVGEATHVRVPGEQRPVLRRAPGHVHPDPGLSEQKPGAGQSCPSLWAVSRFPPGCALVCGCCAKPGGSLHAPRAAASLPAVRLIWCIPGKAACSISGQAPVSTQPTVHLAWRHHSNLLVKT